MADAEEFQPQDDNLVKNRFGSDGTFSYDKDRLDEVRAFCERVMAAAREQA
jgi:hypothetical protein